MDVYKSDFITAGWEEISRVRSPAIAVAGYALGGGCEIAMMCDFIPRRRYGEIRPAGNHYRHDSRLRRQQRLARFVGKSKAMEMCLTGRMMDAQEPNGPGW
jgi:enoyl-CoA hydratase